jgi:hypothetical protein
MSLHVPSPSVAQMLLGEYRNKAYSLRYLGAVVADSGTLTAVTFSFVPSTGLAPSSTLPSDQVWYFNPQTGLPVRVEYKLANPKPGVVHLQAIDFSDYRAASGVLYPFHVVMHRDDSQDQVVSLQSVTPASSVALAPQPPLAIAPN